MTRLVAYMSTPGGLTGAPRRLLTLASALKKQGIETCVATQSDSELLQAAAAEGHATAPVDAVGVLSLRQGALFGGGALFRLKAIFDLLRQNWRLFRCICREGGDVVWIRGSKGIAFGALGAVLSGRPLVWDVDYELPSRGVVRWLHRFGLWSAKRVVFQYSAAPDAIFGPELAARYRHKFLTIIPGIDLLSLEPFGEKRMVRERREGDPFVTLQVGTICNRKNQELLIDALVRVREARPNDRILVQLAGDVFEEDYAEALRQQIQAARLCEEVELLGWRSDVHELMARADLLAMPSRDEGVPNTVQEAMAIGLPVLVSEGGGMPEIVRDGQTGWILPLGAPGEWAQRIERCMDDKAVCDDIGRDASAHAAAHFGTAEWGRQYAQVILDAIGADSG